MDKLLYRPREALEVQRARQARYRADMGTAWPDADLVVHDAHRAAS